MRGARGLAFALALLLPAAGRSAEHDHGGADAMAAEHQGDRPVASAAAQAEPRAPVETAEVDYGSVAGKTLHGFLARPKGAGPGPGIVVIHEWWGLNDNIRSMAKQLAGEGYTALAVDLYGGQVASDPQAAMALMQSADGRRGELLDNLRAAHRFLAARQHVTRSGVIGWCFGGGWALQDALAQGKGLDAAVMYYGRVETDPAALAPLGAPLLGLFAGRDRSIPPDQVQRFQQALAKLGKPAEIHVYDEADHAFANPSGTRYDPGAAHDAWQRTLAFLGRTLHP
jgi:carboxymethylenebutenolidase